MIEHRLIERMVRLMEKESDNIEKTEKVDVDFIDTAVDFLRTYADKCHHGKEEDILFTQLTRKPMIPEHKRTMDELLEDHVLARQTVGALVDANQTYLKGDMAATAEIVKRLKILTDLYPEHIRKEDKGFFVPCMDYFTKEERDVMLSDFFEFDRRMIHERYKSVVERSEKEKESAGKS
ncbi:MAG: hemerythrin domain-containing protein [Methanomassiliicoccales archaeon]|nr:hemerythrin domain-containing protein [Methanomassiliicoccales archaeon]